MIVRSDVPLGVQAAMIVHAAGHSAQLPGAHRAAPPCIAVALTADPDELAVLARRLLAEDLPHVLVREPDEPWRDALMAIGVVPMPRMRAKKLLAHLRVVSGKATP